VERVLLTDFGLARTVDDASLTHTGIVSGTPHYMSPEQAQGDSTDHRTDLFSLGCVLYYMATGHPPFRAERAMGVLNRICHDRHRPVWQVNPDIPDELSDLIDQLLEKKPTRRFATANEAKDALTKLLSRLQVRNGLRPGRAARFMRRHRTDVLLPCAALALAALLAWYYWPSPPASPLGLALDSETTEPLTVPPAKLSVDDIQSLARQLTPNTGELADLSERIEQIDADLDESRFARASDEFAEKVFHLDQTLDQLNPEAITTIPSLPDQGDK
jgi:hypothetical protein